jgi:hypothetical protein
VVEDQAPRRLFIYLRHGPLHTVDEQRQDAATDLPLSAALKRPELAIEDSGSS